MLNEILQLNQMALRATMGLGKATVKAVGGSAQIARYGVDQHRRAKGHALAARGFLAPGDGPAPPGSPVLDYRGLSAPAHVALPSQGIPLGRVVDLERGGAARPVALPVDRIKRHACIIGPPGSGKTYSLIVPWTAALLAAGCSVVTVDVKGDFLDELRAYLDGRPLGVKGIVWDYAAPRTHRWNFLREIRTERQIEAAVVSVIGKKKDNDPQPFFYQRDYRWLKGLVRLTLEAHGSTARPRHLLDLLMDPDMVAALLPASAAAADLFDLATQPDYSQATAGLLNALSVFREASVARATEESDFTLDEVLAEPTLLVGVARIADAQRAEQLSSLLLSQLNLAVLDRFGQRSRTPVVFMIDEAPRIKDRIDLEQLLAVVRGADAGVVLAAQDVGQFGDERAQSALLASCHTYVSMPGVSPVSAQYLSNRLGTMAKEEFSVSVGGRRGLFEPESQTRQMTVGPVLGTREIMNLPHEHHALVHLHGLTDGPFLVDVSR